MARSLLVAHAMLEDGVLEGRRTERYAGWDGPLGTDILHSNGPGGSLGSLHHFVADTELDPEPISGRQEELENLVNRYIERTR